MKRSGLRERIADAVRQAAGVLAGRDDASLREVFERSRVERDGVYRTMDEYGEAFGLPPRHAYDRMRIGRIDGSRSEFRYDVLLWDEAGRETDLSLVTAIAVVGVLIDDVRVM